MSEISKHINLGNGLTAEFMHGVVILFRIHKDATKVPGDIQESLIAREVGGKFEMVESNGERARFLVHETGPDKHEFKAYTGEILVLSQRRAVKRFLEQINFTDGKIDRYRNGRPPRVIRTGKGKNLKHR